MKLLTASLAVLHISSHIVAAHPFIIISTNIQNVVPTHAHGRRQNLLDDIASAVNSVFGGDSGATATVAAATTRASAVTLAAPMTATITTSSKQPKSDKSSATDQSTSDSSDDSTRTSSDQGSTTTDDSSTATTAPSTSDVTLSTSSTSPASVTTTASPTAIQASSSGPATPTATSSNDNADSNTVPAGGIAIAVIMILLILSITAFLIFRYHPRCQAWWTLRQEKARQERCYREAIDGPSLSSSPTLRQQALAGGSSKRRTMLQSFFAPATARLSDSSEIKRKPVNWGVPASPPVPKIPAVSTPASKPEPESEKLSMTASSAPLGQIERYSMMPAPISLPPPPPPPKSSPKTTTTPMPTPPPASKTFIAELPACMPPAPLKRSQTNTTVSELPTRSLSSAYNPPKTPTRTQTCPVSPMTLCAQPTSPMLTTLDQLAPVSPISTYTTRQPQGMDHSRPISSITTSTVGANTTRFELQDVPVLPPLPVLPALAHAKRGSDGVFRLA